MFYQGKFNFLLYAELSQGQEKPGNFTKFEKTQVLSSLNFTKFSFF